MATSEDHVDLELVARRGEREVPLGTLRVPVVYDMSVLADPDYRARLLADLAAVPAGTVEVDNPLRREVRPRRGTEPSGEVTS
ncbi:hypothetical protein [Cellulosimicrobium protaetiae]